MAKYQFKVEIKAPAGETDVDAPTIDEVRGVIEGALEAAYPGAEAKAYDGERTDID